MGYVVGVWWEGGKGERDRETNPQISQNIWLGAAEKGNDISQILQKLPK